MTLQEKINKALENGNVDGAKKLLSIHFQEEDNASWLKTMTDEHEALFPSFKQVTFTDEEGNEVVVDEPIDYQLRDDYIPFHTWMNEEIIVTKYEAAVYEDDVLVKEQVQEVTKRVREFTPKPSYVADIDLYLATSPLYKAIEKQNYHDEKEALKVTNNTIEFDADLSSIVYFNSVVNLANLKMIQAFVEANPGFEELYNAVYKTSIGWKGADNKVHNVQVESISEVLDKTMQELAQVVGV